MRGCSPPARAKLRPRGTKRPARQYAVVVQLFPDESVRKPDPAPTRTNDRIPMLIGTGLWLLALVGLLAIPGALEASPSFWLPTCLVGFGLGLIGLAYTHLRR